MIRRALDRVAGPGVQALLGRLENRVDAGTLEDRARRMLCDTRAWAAGEGRLAPGERGLLVGTCEQLERALTPGAPWPRATPTAPIPGTRRFGGLLARTADEGAAQALEAHLAGLAGGMPASGLGELDAEVEGLGARLDEDARSDPSAVSLAILAGMRCGLLSRAAARRGALAIAKRRPEDWFPRSGVRHGTANLLRVLLATPPADADRESFEARVSERLLRHVEVRRERALRPLRPLEPWRQRLEGIRFTLALLDVAERLGDARFLNAALKRNDRAHRELRRARGRRLSDHLVSVHHAASVARQEALFPRLFPCAS